MSIASETKSIIDRFAGSNVSLDEKEVSSRLVMLVDSFKVPISEASRTVSGFFRQKHNIKFEDFQASRGPAGLITIDSVLTQGDNKWISVKAKVVQLWESKSESVSQVGLIGDSTGVTKITIFSKNGEMHPKLVEGTSYYFGNLVTSLYAEKISLKANKSSEIHECEAVEVVQQTETITGIITAIQSGSGLIKRCPECNRKLTKGACQDHGKVEGSYDLRLKAVISPIGKSDSIDLIIDAAVTEQATGRTLAKAKELATEALSIESVLDELKPKVLGRYFEVTGSLISTSSNMIVETIKPAPKLAGESQIRLAIAAGGN